MREPYRPWLYYMTKYHGIFPKGSREKHDANYFKNGPIGLGTGPAQFVEWLQNDRVVLNRNPNYWRKGVPTWDKLVVELFRMTARGWLISKLEISTLCQLRVPPTLLP